MKKNKIAFALIAIVLSTSFMMCTKSQMTEDSEILPKKVKSEFLIKEAKNLAVKNQVLGSKMADDADWKAMKKISGELLSILIVKSIDLHDQTNFENKKFYERLGGNAQEYKDKLALGKKHAKAFMDRYFPNRDNCSSCNVLDNQKKLAYANALDKARNAITQKNKKTNAMTTSEAPDCWTIEFFACGGVCAMTIELPPAFALCLALCAAEYCD